jgi:light-regulated signal transduction histidine kinase (bacteriophytochrome)
MKPHTIFPTHSSAEADPGEARAERLLRGMYKVCSHDLPNQMVVLQSLLQMLQMEELDRLSPDGQEYVTRLSSAALRAGALVRFLKEMGRLYGYQPQFEEVSLTALARELRAELNQLCPGQGLEYEWHWHVPTVRADYRPFYQSLLGLLQGRVETAGAVCRIGARSQVIESGVELDFQVTPATPVGRTAREQRPEVVLAREWLAAGGAELILCPEETGRFIIRVPY